MSETTQERAMTIATNLKRIREAKKLTQRDRLRAGSTPLTKN